MKVLKLMAICLLVATATAWGGEAVDRTLAADKDAVIEIENLSGSLRITGWDRNEIRVTGTLGDDVEELRFEGERDRFQIEVEVPESRGFGKRDISADLEISVPEGSGLEIETVSAPITVSDVNSWVELSSVSGTIEVRGAMTEAEVETVSGSITLSGANTVVEAESVSGTIELEGVGRAVEVSTVSGSVKVEGGELNRARFESVAGGIDFDGSLGAGGRLDASCHSCNLLMTLPETTSATFEISTFSGNISSDLGGTVEKTSRYAPGKRSEFSTGSGDGRVSLETFSGNVKLKKR
jgi:DUF4097 and DUF4098 domain-containing protein YvlB